MTPTEYQSLAKRTAGKFDTENEALVNWALGLAGESGEVLGLWMNREKKTPWVERPVLIKELGDVLWYTAMMCEQAGLDLGSLTRPSRPESQSDYLELTFQCCNIADYIKKVACHGHDLDVDRLSSMLAAVYFTVSFICATHSVRNSMGHYLTSSIDVSEVMETNIAKLKARYPEGFSTERSINRTA